jgi:hypothetical protein
MATEVQSDDAAPSNWMTGVLVNTKRIANFSLFGNLNKLHITHWLGGEGYAYIVEIRFVSGIRIGSS